MNSVKVVSEDTDPFISNNKYTELRQELSNFLKCIEGKPAMFLAICEYNAVDGGRIDESCKVLDKKLIYTIMRDAIYEITANKPVDGKEGNWNCGMFGSRWMDIDAQKYNIDYISCAFYSRKHNKQECGGKPYCIQITCEKGK